MKCNSLNKQGFVTLFLLSLLNINIGATTPTPSFTYTIQNEVQTSDRTLEFDVYLLNTEPSIVLEAAGVQLGIKFNSAILNGGTITPTFVSGYSEMVSAQNPNNMQYDETGPIIKISPRSLPGWKSGTIISTTAPGTRICRIKLTNSEAFASASANLAHQFSGIPYRSLLSYYDHDTGKVYDFTLSATNSFTSTTNPVLNSLAVVTTDGTNASTNVISGAISSLGSPYPSDFGFVYSSTNGTPTILDHYVGNSAATAVGSYNNKINGLTGGTIYSVRAYVTNSVGTAYGDILTFTAAELNPKDLSYSTPNTFTKGTVITDLPPTVTGTVKSFTVHPDLPTGLNLNESTGIISGTPTVVASIADYTVLASNDDGIATATVKITVNDVAPSDLSYSTPKVFTKGVVIEELNPTVSGNITNYSISPALPSGLAIDETTGAISGTPTVISSIANYTVTASNSGGSTTKILSITVNDVEPSSLSYATPNIFIKGSVVSGLTPSISGGTVTNYSISPSLPTGLSIDPTTGVIDGTPSVVSSATDYTVTATNSGGSTTATVNILVQDVNRKLTLRAYLQGLWNTNTQMMNQCMQDNSTPKYAGASDLVTIELHDSHDYATIITTISNLLIDMDGTIHSAGKSYIDLSGAYTGNYYVTIKTRSHVKTTTASSVSFASENVNYDFSTAANQAYGSNQVKLKDGVFGIYAGDINQDGVIDNLDITQMDTNVQAFATGYMSEDLNGDSYVDNLDASLLNNGVFKFIYVLIP